MSSVLLFMDQTITVRLVNSPAYHLKKGAGYHMVSPPCLQPKPRLEGLSGQVLTRDTENWTPLWNVEGLGT